MFGMDKDPLPARGKPRCDMPGVLNWEHPQLSYMRVERTATKCSGWFSAMKTLQVLTTGSGEAFLP